MPPPHSDASSAGGVITVRAVAIACGLMPLLALWVVESELIWYTGHSTTISLFYHVTFPLFLIGLVNLLIQRWRPQAALTPMEMMTIYLMLCVGGTLVSHDMLQIMIPMLAFPAYNANPQNRWDELILSRVPDWAIVTDPDACRLLAVGNASLYKWHIFQAWIKPLLFWTVFLVALMLALMFINIFFRRLWTERERLSFPVIQIPLLISTNLSALLRSRLFWIGFGVTAGIDIWNGLSFLHPNLPEIPIIRAFEFRDYFVERPWNAIANTEINLYPFVIGLAYFLPTDLAFSCWFFFLFFKAEIVLTAALGLHDLPGAPWPVEQAAGGYLALALLALWLGRRHLRGVWRSILGRPGGIDDSEEPVRYRTAAIGLLICLLILIACGVQLGGSPHMLFFFFVLFFLYSIAIARMRAELGPPAHDLHFMGPEMLMHNALGSEGMGANDATAFSMFFWFNRAYRAHFSAHNMEAFKIGRQLRARSRAIMWVTIIALIVGLASAYWALMHALYIHGYSGRPAGDAFASQGWKRLEGWLSFPQPPRYGATFATIFGIIFAVFLGLMRTRFIWWVWHPVGYATATCWSMGKLWACLFLGWLAKAIITRYGGARAYRQALPLFVGMVLGEFVVGSLWCIWGAVMSRPVYHFWG